MNPTEDNFEEQFVAALEVEETKPPIEEPKEEEPKEGVENIPEGDKKEEKPEEEAPKEEEPKEEPEEPEAPQPLTKDDVRSVISELRQEERTSSRELDETVNEVLEAYYPKGLSNTLVDEASGKELKTPQDVVDASGGTMSTEEAAQWLMNEQFKLDKQISEIKDNAKQIAETTLKFKQDGEYVLEKYGPLFEKYPHLQKQAWDGYMELVEKDDAKNVVLKAPDMQKFYSMVLEPYRLAFEFSQQQAATAPVKEEAPQEPPKPSAEDRMDESGDGGHSSDVDDPNDFAQQIRKELKTGV